MLHASSAYLCIYNEIQNIIDKLPTFVLKRPHFYLFLSSFVVKPRNIECKDCGLTFTHWEVFKTHLHQHALEEGEEQMRDDMDECDVSSSLQTNHSGLIQGDGIISAPVGNKFRKVYSCLICGKVYIYLVSFRKHQQLHEAELLSSKEKSQSVQSLNKYECPDCGMTFVRRTRLLGHLQVHRAHKEFKTKPPRCDQCNKNFTSIKLSLQCIECHIIFSDHKSKERHLKSSHPAEYEQCILRNALFACYVCDRHFTNSTELMAHQKAHIEKKPFKCPICGQAFNKSSELTLHKKIHFGQDGYACTDCGKPCKTLTLLKYHRRTHTGERPYVCKECGKRFTMSKALQKHIVSHLPEGAEGNKEDGTGNTVLCISFSLLPLGASSVNYSCSICKATFKSTKTRLHHMKTKHNALHAATSNALPAGQQVKQSTPIITPISICQPALLQVEPNGPLQKVDANIDTEQIRRLIESLGNVQKVNQVVILGQVPPHAPPLEVQQITQMAEPLNLNLSSQQINLIGLQHSKSKTADMESTSNPCDSMEQTIILEPITPDGQLENPSFSELGSHITAGENIELTLIQSEQTQRPEGEVMHQILQQPELSVIQSHPVNEMVCQNEVDDLKQDLETTVILELTPALIPTLELEQSQTAPRNEIPSSSLVPTTELEKTAGQTPDQTVIHEQEANMSVPPLMSTVELELTPLQTEQQDLPSCPFIPLDALTQTPNESETNPKEEVNSQIQTISLDRVQCVIDGAPLQVIQERTEQESLETLLVDSKGTRVQVENLSEGENTSAKEDIPLQAATKEVSKISEIPVNVMSAQELVKVRKRKPARAFLFQGYMQELVGSLYKDDLHIDSKPAKRQRTRKSHLVVKFGPQSKEKKNKKQKKPSHQHQPTLREEIKTNISRKNIASQKKGRKGKTDKNGGLLVSTAEKISSSLTQVPQMQHMKEDTRKNKIKKQKEEAGGNMTHISEHKTVASPVFKKKKQKARILRKNSSTTAKDVKRKKNLAKEEKGNSKAGAVSADIPGPCIMQESLLLLKGHKQPQLKVYKLDPSKASAQTQEASPHDHKHPISESTNNLTAEGKKKGGRPKKNQKALSLLSSLQVSHQQPETLPTKPKATRKRKSSLKVETEGVITSHSKRALECKDCGERFSEVSSLQKHKAMVHIVESPGLTYTNGNIFEGVSRLDLYHFPKQHDKAVGVMSTATGWDTEPEMGEMALEDKERTVSFPALIPSPSLPVPPPDLDMTTVGDKSGSKSVANDQSHTSSEVHPPSEALKNNEVSANFISDCALSTSTQIESLETGEHWASQEAKQEEGTSKHLSSESEVPPTTDEDIKEDLLLEVDVVTVGEQNEREDTTSPQESIPQNESKEACQSEGGSTETPERKKEAFLVTVPSPQGTVTRNAAQGKRQGTGQLKRGVISKQVLDGDTVTETESEKEQDECQVVYEKHPVTSDSEIHAESETSKNTSQPETSPDAEATKPSAEEQVVFELESVTTSVEEVMNERGLQGGEEHDRDTDQSPGIILEKFLTSRQSAAADKEPCVMTTRTNGRQPIDYFSKYFGWESWVEIANCTNKLSNITNSVTAREVAQFVGIHIAMGTLKFPSLRLYWEDLTKVPLIAEAMPLSRFLELSRMLNTASVIPQHSDEMRQGDIPNDLSCSKIQTDPLWKVQPLLCRFKAGCQSLKREDDYAVDQYPLPLTGKVCSNKPSLYCTTLIGFGGFLLHVDLKLDRSDKEDAVEKMAPKGSMVFLCKQELSTPAMLERLLVAGVHGAGRVGGARGQIGDEFVSSDGKLMLRRSHCGFILSTAGNGQRNMSSLIDNFEKAQMLARLNRDLLNLYSIPLTASAPACWPQAVLWYLTDLALVNSWLLYREEHRAASAPLTLMTFRLEVSKALILSSGSDTQDSVPPHPPTETHTTNETPSPTLVEECPLPDAATRYDGSGHWPEQLAEGEGGRCRFGDCQRTSRVLCLKCCVFLCISRNHNCFLNFHNQENLGKG
uniref:C2H2-type domain-containing protein n=1 Tax=Anabas testudineus TaxID=64144 RepID=A0A3Q1JMC3_ANATE